MSLLDKASLVVTPNAYKASKLYSVIPSDGSGDMTVVRATTATRINSSSLIENVATNVPRIDYTNGSCPSLLVEPQRTNLLTYSEQFDNVIWVKQNTTVTANSITSPSGVSNADSLIASNGTANFKGLYTAQGASAPKSFSFFAKKGNKDWAILLGYNGDNNCWFNVSTGTIGTIGSNYTNAKIENYGNGWYRCSATLNTLISGTNLGIYVSNADNSTSCTGDGSTPSLYIWGAQCEAGAYASSYVPTVATAVTRNADVISKTGISSLIGQTEGTIFIDFNVNNLTSQTSDPVIFSTSGTNYIRLSVARVISYFESNTVSIVSASNVIINGRNKIAVNYKNNDFSLYVNGVLVGSNNSGSVVAKSNFALNYLPTSIFDPSLFYNSIQLYKTKLTNTESIAITTL